MATSRKLKVGLVFDDSLDASDGVAQYVKRLGAWLSDQGHEVRYLVGETKMVQWHGGKVYSLSKNLTVHFNGNKLSMPLIAKQRHIKQVLDDEQFDILHVQLPYSPLMAQRVINLADHDVAVVGTFHIFPANWLANFGGRLLGLVSRRSLKKFSRIVSVSSAAALFAKKTFGIETSVIPNPVDTRLYAKADHKRSSKQPQIVFLGRLVPRKGCRQLLEAFRLLIAAIPEAHLTIAGDGPQRSKLEKKLKNYGLSDSVTFTGFIDEQHKPSLLASADIACFPSLGGESFGIVLIEAMAAGSKVVLGGNNPGYRTILGAKPELLIDPNDTEAFAARLIQLLNDQPLIDQLHSWQRNETKKYDIEVVGHQVLNLYGESIACLGESRHNNNQ